MTSSFSHATPSGPPAIIVDKLCKRFDKHLVLDNLSFEVQRGETLVILGRSGTGKSVTLKSIIGLLEPSSGHIEVLGQSPQELSEHERLAYRKNIGYVFQYAALFDSLSILENVGFPLYQDRMDDDIIERQVRERLSMVGLSHTLEKYPDELSGGMRKRAGLARAIINLPPIVLYDEPTSGLDPLTTDVINQIILRLRSQLSVTSVVVTHDIASAFTIADRIIMLDQGRIVTSGTPADIQHSDNPWVQSFISGKALESERIDTARFSSIPREQETQTWDRIRAATSGEHTAVPPSIRSRRQQKSSSRLAAVTTQTDQAKTEKPKPQDEPAHTSDNPFDSGGFILSELPKAPSEEEQD